MLDRVAKADWMPLTLAQLDFWEEYSLYPGRPLSTVAHCVEIHGTVDEAALRQAITRTIREAEVLSLRFSNPQEDGQPRQCHDPRCTPSLEEIDLQDCANPAEQAREHIRSDLAAPLNLLDAPISAQWLFRLGPAHYLWYIRAHHIVLDGFGMSLIEHRCARLYRHFLGEGEGGSAFHPFARFLEEEQTYRDSLQCDRDRHFWQEYLPPEIKLPQLAKGGEDYGGEAWHEHVELPATFTRRLQELGAGASIGWPDLLLLLSAIALFQRLPTQTLDGQRVLPLWVPYMSRWGSVGAHMPGLLVNILPLLVRVHPCESLAEILVRLARELREQRTHGRYRIEQIAMNQQLPKGSRYFFSPLVNVLPFPPPEFSGCRIRHDVLASGPGDGFNLTYRSLDHDGRLDLSMDADAGMFSAEEFAGHCRALTEFLARTLEPGASERTMRELCQKSCP